MAESEYKSHDNPCAFCGNGEPSSAPSNGICALCLQYVQIADDLQLVRLPALAAKVILFPIESNNIKRAGWRNVDGSVGVLVVQFHGGSQSFQYANVAREWWERFLAAESKGSFFHNTVRADKTAYPFTKIN